MESIAYTTFCLETPPLSGVLDCSAPSAPLFSGYFKLSWAVMGSATLASISFAPVADAIVAQGDRCPEVKDIQNSLTTAQYSVGTIDGIFGAQTHAALVRFQIAKGLKGDGVVGPVTAKALGLEAKEVYALNTLCGTPAAKPSETASQRYIVVPNALNVRSGPGTTYPVVAVLTKGTAVTGIAEESGWIQTGADRWIAGEFVTSADSPVLAQSAGTNESSTVIPAVTPSGYIRVTVPSLNVRSGPGTDYDIVGNLIQEEIYPLSGLSTPDGWVQLSWGDWISSDFVEQATETAQ